MQMMMDRHKYVNGFKQRPDRRKEKYIGKVRPYESWKVGGGGRFALEVVAVEMREGPIRALSANCLYGLPFFLRSQKT